MITIKQMNKRAAGSMQGIIEGLLMVILVTGLVAIIVVQMNNLYDKDYSVAGVDYNDQLTKIQSYQANSTENLRTGDVSFLGSLGLSVSTSWNVASGAAQLIWQFLSGNMIRTIIIDWMGLPSLLASILQTLYYIMVGFILLKIIFRVSA